MFGCMPSGSGDLLIFTLSSTYLTLFITCHFHWDSRQITRCKTEQSNSIKQSTNKDFRTREQRKQQTIEDNAHWHCKHYKNWIIKCTAVQEKQLIPTMTIAVDHNSVHCEGVLVGSSFNYGSNPLIKMPSWTFLVCTFFRMTEVQNILISLTWVVKSHRHTFRLGGTFPSWRDAFSVCLS